MNTIDKNIMLLEQKYGVPLPRMTSNQWLTNRPLGKKTFAVFQARGLVIEKELLDYRKNKNKG